ncbi:RICIN domain-containing protein [Streptomyces sp. NPDC085932]|uniref:RICIN domain-containing protein n=1 Tax=Streptomyces sp. NPDC085932 TaxID=3365741 RepID=UPI0037CF4C23
MTVSTAVTLSGSGGAAALGGDYEGAWEIRNDLNLTVDALNNVSAQGQPMQARSLIEGNTLSWELVPVSNLLTIDDSGRQVESFKFKAITAENHDLCLEATGASPSVGAVVQQYRCDPNAKDQPNQSWFVYKAPAGHTYLVNGASWDLADMPVGPEGRGISSRVWWRNIRMVDGEIKVTTYYNDNTHVTKSALVIEAQAQDSTHRLYLKEGLSFPHWQHFSLKETSTVSFDEAAENPADEQCNVWCQLVDLF